MEVKACGSVRVVVETVADIKVVGELVRLFEAIGAEEGWVPGDQIKQAAAISEHIVALVNDEVAGGIQVALPDAAGNLPYRQVWPELDIPARGAVAEITVLAVEKRFRRYHLFWPLCVELWRLCIKAGISTLVVQATPPMLSRYRKIGWPLEVIGELREHFGEPVYNCQLDVRTVAGSIVEMAYRHPSYRGIVQGLVRSDTVDCRNVQVVA